MLFFAILFICFLRFNFEAIVIPSSVTDETDLIVIPPICNTCKLVIARIINWNLSDLRSLNFIQIIHIRVAWPVQS